MSAPLACTAAFGYITFQQSRLQKEHWHDRLQQVQSRSGRKGQRRGDRNAQPSNALNAVNPDMNADFDTLFRDLSDDDEIDAIILTGAGRAFCAGGDIKNMDARNEGAAADFPMNPRDPGDLLNAILDVQQPIIAAINGDAIGLGATIALFCDIQVAAETARLADTHVRIGVVAGDGGAVIWPPLIGPNRAKEFLMRGNLINGAEAAKIGLVNYAVPVAEVMPKARELARELADGPRWAIRWTKLSVNKLVRKALNQVLDTSAALEAVTFVTPQHREAARAFVEKRKPNFRALK
jgi:enoyl-CoA hydratase